MILISLFFSFIKKIRFFKVILSKDLNFYVALNIIRDDYEEAIVNGGLVHEDSFKFFISYLESMQPERKLLDIGANIGLYSLSASAMKREVIAVEMTPENCLMLEYAKKRNSFHNLEILNYAVGDSIGQVRYEGRSAWATTTNASVAGNLAQGIFMERLFDPKIQLVKMDIEGSELNALESGTSFLSSENIDFIVEVNILACGNHNYSSKRIFEIFENGGFTSYRIVGERKLWKWSKENFQEIVYTDYFFTKRSIFDLKESLGFQVEDPSFEIMKSTALIQNRYGAPHWAYHLANKEEMLRNFKCDNEIVSYLSSLVQQGQEELIDILKIGS